MRYQHEIYFFGVEEPIYIINKKNNLNELNEMIKESGYNPANIATINTKPYGVALTKLRDKLFQDKKH